MARILVVDDERDICDLLVRTLARDGHEVDAEVDPTLVPGRDLARYDLVLTDVMMPGLDGFELVRQIRDRVDAPIIFLTAKVSEEDAVVGLGLGGDDYLRKPFGTSELRAKVAAHLRRERRVHHATLGFGRVRLDLAGRELTVDGEVVSLTPTEYAICEFLARRPGQVFSRTQILEKALGWGTEASEEAISVHVSNLRAKLRQAGVDPVQTVWGVGYRWQE